MKQLTPKLARTSTAKTWVLASVFLWLFILALLAVSAVYAEGVLVVGDKEQPTYHPSQPQSTIDRHHDYERPDSQGVKRPTTGTLELYEQHCATCHGGDGRGVEATVDFPTIPNFADISWQRSRSQAQLTASIINGRGDGMPPFSDELTRSQIAALVDHIRSFALVSVDKPPRRLSDFSRKYDLLKQEWEALVLELQELRSRD